MGHAQLAMKIAKLSLTKCLSEDVCELLIGRSVTSHNISNSEFFLNKMEVMCLVRSWNIGLTAICSAVWLSQCMAAGEQKNQEIQANFLAILLR